MITIGDTIAVLDEDISGKVVGLHGNEVVIIDQDGFEMTFLTSEVVKMEAQDVLVPRLENVQQIIKEKEGYKKPKPTTIKVKKRQQPPMEVDLHIHKLVKSTKRMTNYDMLNIQMDTAKRQLNFAISKRIQRVVFIHGVGEGVLKAELEYLFRDYDNIQVSDADYKKYGLGAMEVYILQNPRG